MAIAGSGAKRVEANALSRAALLPPLIVEYRRVLAQLLLERRRLRSRHLVYLGSGRMLVGLDMGMKVSLDLSAPEMLIPLLQPSPADLAIVALSALVLRPILEPIAILVGAEHLLHAMNLLALSGRGCLHFIEPRQECHAQLQAALPLNEGIHSTLHPYAIALGGKKRRVAFRYKKCTIDLLNCLDGEKGSSPHPPGKGNSHWVASPRSPLEQIVGDDVAMRAHLLVIDTAKHLSNTLKGIEDFWLFNPYGHLVVRFDPHYFDQKAWAALQAQLARYNRRIWSLPKALSVEETLPNRRTLWITPSGV